MDAFANNTTTVKQRLVSYLSYKGISHRSFERQCNLGNGYINNIRKSIQPDKLQKIISHYPDLSVEWLMSGNGEMLKCGLAEWEKNMTDEDLKSSDVVRRLRFYIKSIGDNEHHFEREAELPDGWVSGLKKSVKIEDFASLCMFHPDLNASWLLTGIGNMQNVGYRPEDLPQDKKAGRQDSTYDIHHNEQVTINDLAEKLSGISAELAAMREERQRFLTIIDNLNYKK